MTINIHNLRLFNRSSFQGTENFWQALYLTQLRFPGFTFEVRDFYYAVCEYKKIDYDPQNHSPEDINFIMREIRQRFELDILDMEALGDEENKEKLSRCHNNSMTTEWLTSAVTFCIVECH